MTLGNVRDLGVRGLAVHCLINNAGIKQCSAPTNIRTECP
jgi:hypothetical protein